VAYFAGGKRQRRQFADLEKAKTVAADIAKQEAQGALGAAALTATDRVALESALILLAATDGLGTPQPPGSW
jgi:hypothetical protein